MDPDSNPFTGAVKNFTGTDSGGSVADKAISSVQKVQVKEFKLPTDVNSLVGDQMSGVIMEQLLNPPVLYYVIGVGVFVFAVVVLIAWLIHEVSSLRKSVKANAALASANSTRAAQLRVQSEETRTNTANTLASLSGRQPAELFPSMGLNAEGRMEDRPSYRS